MMYARTRSNLLVELDNYKGNDIEIVGETIEELIEEGDLVKYADLTTSYPYQEQYTEIGKFFRPHHTHIYRVVELYIKQENGDFKLVARDKGNYKLELV